MKKVTKQDAVRSQVWLVFCPSKPWLSEAYDSSLGMYEGLARLQDTFKGEVFTTVDGRAVQGESTKPAFFYCMQCGSETRSQRGWIARQLVKHGGALCGECYEGQCDAKESMRHDF